ncbi:hypothetical protein FA13DRAFT_1812630 [Coprinellus micaceus]|uniref:Uncharacterized protein n=1 Tax=Coprinellus micaceus TaxID=71717 RepID=A0A4Y7THJ3_COPMI|nr:hypothetical protein FA13DRAFT_1812630 [Coprinellus micaceus]
MWIGISVGTRKFELSLRQNISNLDARIVLPSFRGNRRPEKLKHRQCSAAKNQSFGGLDKSLCIPTVLSLYIRKLVIVFLVLPGFLRSQ